MNVLDAFCNLVNAYPGGASALAARMKMNRFTLAHKADPNNKTHRPAIDEVVLAEQLSGDHRVLFAHADQLGYGCVRLHLDGEVSDEQLLAQAAKFMKETGEALQAFQQAIADGRITENEVKEFERQAADIAPVAAQLAARLRAIADKQSLERASTVR